MASTPRYYALWVTRHGQRFWAGPFETNVRAASHPDNIIDKSGGYLVTRGIPMTPGEAREARRAGEA